MGVLIGIAPPVNRIKQPGAVYRHKGTGHDIRISADVDEFGQKADTAVSVDQQELCLIGINIVGGGRTEMTSVTISQRQQRVDVHGNDILGLQGGEVDRLVFCLWFVDFL